MGKKMSDLFSFWKVAPTRNRLYPCPSCNETISADASSCRFCHVAIDAATAQRLVTESQRVTTAVAQAKTFSFSRRFALLLAGFALFNLYLDRSLTESLVLCSFVAFGYGAWWLYHNRSCVTQDADFPAATSKVKGTMMVWFAVLVVQLAAYLIVNGWRRTILQLPQPVVRQIIHDGNNRPALSIASVETYHFPPYPGEKDPWSFPMLVVTFKNEGNTPARLTQGALTSYESSDACNLTFKDKHVMGIVIPPGYANHALFAVKARHPCRTSGLLKLTLVYTNLASGVEYTEELSASADLVFGDEPVH
jgi:hypothetical protein